MERLLGSDESPARLAAAYSVGVFFGFSPFLGLHILMALGVAFACRLNRVAVLGGVWTNLPWFMIPWYSAMTMLAAAATGVVLPSGLTGRLQVLLQIPVIDRAFWYSLAPLVGPFLWPFFLGSTVGAAVLGLVAYPVALHLIKVRRGDSLRAALETQGDAGERSD